MKNLILNWLGVSPWAINNFEGDGRLPSAVNHIVRKELASFKDELVDYAKTELNRSYDLQGMESKLDDMDYLTQDLESRGNRWDDMSDKVEDLDMEAIVDEVFNQVNFDKVKQLDDRLTELVAGYKLDVQLIKEEF